MSAQYMCDKHVVKMILESAQLLCTSHHVCPTGIELPEKFYKQTHTNHPSAVWVRASTDNYSWLTAHANALLSEYTHRYEKQHASTPVIEWCSVNIPNIPDLGFTDIPLWNAIIMNLLGILFFYIHERVWDNFDYGRYIEESK